MSCYSKTTVQGVNFKNVRYNNVKIILQIYFTQLEKKMYCKSNAIL